MKSKILKNSKNKILIRIILFCTVFLLLQFTLIPIYSISLYHSLGYNFARNESYIDTVENKDIFWNPNTGFKISLGAYSQIVKSLFWRVELSANFGSYDYATTDGRKVNTEAEAENVPKTENKEWSRIYSIIPSLSSRHNFKKYILDIGIGAGPYFTKSYESWDFKNSDSKNAHLELTKYYPVTIGFVGRISFEYKLNKKTNLVMEAQYEAVNFVMTQVDLTSYTLNGNETIDKYERKQKTYNYARDVPDESKGGEALLAGFNFSNFPQEKIGTVFTIKLGASYRL